MATRVTLPIVGASGSTDRVVFLAYTVGELDGALAEMERIVGWAPPTHVAHGCPDRVESMRRAAGRFVDNLTSEGNGTEEFLDYAEITLGAPELLEVQTALRGYERGAVIPPSWAEPGAQARSLYRDLTTVGCRRKGGVILSVLGGLALVSGAIAFFRRPKRRGRR